MSIRKHARTLALASILALAIVSVPALHVDAKQKTTAQPATCAYFNPATGAWEFYQELQAIQVKGSDGKYHLLVCGSDGNWVQVNRTTEPSVPLEPSLPVSTPLAS